MVALGDSKPVGVGSVLQEVQEVQEVEDIDVAMTRRAAEARSKRRTRMLLRRFRALSNY
jgi:hypothetical protein